MDFKEANKLEQKRAEAGIEPCVEHPQITKERLGGMSSGDYRCTTCGAEITPNDAREWKSRRKA